VGSNFEAARGFTRTNWKTRDWDPSENPLVQDSSDEEYGSEYYYDEDAAEGEEIEEEEPGEGDDGTESPVK